MGKAERTKQFIVEQVAPIFNRKGYAATSLKDLTNVTGLTKGSIYGNFKNKDEVALYAFEYNADFVNRQLREHLLLAESPREKLLAYPKTFRKIYSHILESGGCPILNTAVDSSEVNSLLLNAVQQVIEKWKSTIISIIEEGIHCGEFNRGNDANKTAQVLICLIEGGYAMSKATGDVAYIESSLEQVESIIMAL